LNRWGLAIRTFRESRQDVELAFVFDAFCNAYVPYLVDFLFGYFFIHIFENVFKTYWIFSILLPNSIFIFTFLHSSWILIESLKVLPFVKRPNFAYVSATLGVIWLFSLVFRWRLARTLIGLHFVSTP
jgi:hypothetical protein